MEPSRSPHSGRYVRVPFILDRVSILKALQPFNADYQFKNTSADYEINDLTVSKINPYKGGGLQQASSVVSKTGKSCPCWFSRHNLTLRRARLL